MLCLGGGGLRAAFEVPILEALLSAHRYDLILGISAGAVNGFFAAQGTVEGSEGPGRPRTVCLASDMTNDEEALLSTLYLGGS